MDRLTREQIEALILAHEDEPAHERPVVTNRHFIEICRLALSQEAVRDEVLEEALNHAEVIGNVVSALLDLNVTYDGSRAIFTFETTDNAMGHIWSARDIVAKRLDAIRALKREPNAAGQGTEESSPRQVPSPAPAAPDVANMVKRIEFIRSYASAHIAAEDQNAMRDACALLAKLGQGWIPVSERLPDTTREVELAVRGRDGEIYRAFGYFKNDWRTSVYDPGGTVIAWHDLMPLPPSTGASDD